MSFDHTPALLIFIMSETESAGGTVLYTTQPESIAAFFCFLPAG